MRTILVCGSRDWRDAAAVQHRIREIPERVRIIHGDARGADRLAARFAADLGHVVDAFPANWREHGRAAGLVRNIEMLRQRPDLVIAFWCGGSTGTLHTITHARQRGIPVEVIKERRPPDGPS